ncbi:MAG: flavodoxin family protein [Candidatus Bathyarchaeota archaeon]|nr:flavodoxin family protein [Candidatus Bathyarchaeum tardum]WGM88543.1 MAG: flavodoxin family protein [Candidatus Bathyarchaeum tardum]WNZ29186.1 MAG: flavodoxin family protein [Candidatus Bathyarchaeota archaeon]
MKILALIGSPRQGGNTDLLVNRLLDGAKSNGYDTEKLYLYDYNISLCTDCRNCKKGDYVCCINDEMSTFYDAMESADVIVFGTPIYWYGPTAKMKMLIDRMRPFVENKKLAGKRAVIVSPSAEGPVACEPMQDMFERMFVYIKVKLAGTVFGKAYNKGDITKDQTELGKAYTLGASL